MPATVGSQIKGPCSRIDYMKQYAGIDVQAMYPAGAPPKADDWTYDTFLKAAEACHKGGHPFGIGLGTTADNVDTAGAIFHGFGAELVNAKGDITVKSDAVRQALEYYKKLMAFLPPEVPAWDDASNNKFLVSGQASMIMNPPSRLGGRQARRAEGRRAALDARLRRRARRAASRRSRRTSGAPGTSARTSRRPRACCGTCRRATSSRSMVAASRRLRPAVVREVHHLQGVAGGGPAEGHALSTIPNPYNHQILSVAGAPAPHSIGERIYTQATMTQMAVRYFKGEPMEKTLAWAESELEGFMRN